jgi:hypothetical protein
MKQYLLFAWPDGKILDASTFAGCNCYRGDHDTYNEALSSFYRDYYLLEHGHILNTHTGRIDHVDQLKRADLTDN